MYKVETHNNSRLYYKNLDIDKEAIYVASNTSIANMIKEVSNVGIEDRWRVIDIENFIKNIYPSWTNTQNIVKFKNEIQKAILKIREKATDKKAIEELIFLKDNISILASDFRYIIESGIKKLSYKSDSLKLELIKEIFNEVVSGELFKEISKEILDLEVVKKIPNAILESYLKGLDIEKQRKIKEKTFVEIGKTKRIYFYNINNLNLRRYMIAKLLSYAGYEVIFRIPYYSNLNVVNKCWDKVYGDTSLFSIEIDKENLISHKTDVKYVNFLEGKESIEKTGEKITVKNYREVYDYKKVIKGKNVVTFYKDSLSSILDINEVDFTNHCYQNSIGRFLNNLYRCEVREKNIKITFEVYRELITSGWIEVKGWNGIKLHSYLIDNKEYFNGISSMDEIMERIEKLKDIHDVSNIFEMENKDRIGKDSTKEFLVNPFRSFKYANFEKYNITVNYLYEITLKLKRFLIKGLENKDGMINIEEHFKLLIMLFRNKYIVELYNNGTQIQKRVARKIYAILNNPKEFGDIVYKESIQELFNVYLGLDNKKERDVEEEEDFSIDQLEGLIYRDRLFRKNNGVLYIGDMSYKAYEKYMKKFESFNKVLDTKELRYILDKSFIGKSKEIVMEGVRLQEKSLEEMGSYFKFVLANLLINYEGSIEFSWIEGLREDDSKATILKQIEALYGEAKNVAQFLDKKDFVEEDEMNFFDKKLYDTKEITKNMKKIPEAAFRDLDFCGDKFLYSSILEGNPTYSMDFHQKLVFSGLVSILKKNIENGYIDIQKFLLPLFPQWEEVIKKNILDCEFSRRGLREYKYFDGINYPKVVDTLYLLKSKYIVTENSKIRNRYNKGEFNGEYYYKEFIDEYIKDEQNNSGLHCRMCPHSYLCKKGVFAIGNK